MEIWPPRKITLIKKQFDHLHVMRLHESCAAGVSSKVSVLVMEEGIGHLFLITQKTSMLKQKIEKSIPKNKGYHAQN